jgi:hypothetical protein
MGYCRVWSWGFTRETPAADEEREWTPSSEVVPYGFH